jgi:hypothetical protein
LKGFEGDSGFLAERHGVIFSVDTSELRTSDGLPPRISDTVHVWMPKEYRALLPGFYTALGEVDDDFEDGKVVRLYWHLRTDGAERLTARITHELNASQTAFRFKLVADPFGYVRSDAAVLYLSRIAYQRVVHQIAAIHKDLESFCRSPVSAYAKRLGKGLALAEDPTDGSSFGQHRSRLLAAVLTSTPVVEASSTERRLVAAFAAVREAGYDPDRLYLNPGSIDDYEPFADG